jgi:transcriptional regulator with XRE-family HTH domain
MFDRKLFGQNVKFYREKAGYSFNEFSEMADISMNYLFNIEKGKHSPTVATILKILLALQMTYDGLMGEKERPNDKESRYILTKAEQMGEREVRLLLCISENM